MIKSILGGLVIAALLSASAVAGPYHPLGPKIYTPQPPLIVPQPDLVTPQPDIVTPQPDIVTPQDPTITPKAPTIIETEVIVSPSTHESAPNTSLQSFGHCPPMRTMNGGWTARTNVNADCTALSINPGGGGFPAVTRTDVTVTENPDIVTPNPDLITPQPDLVTPQPDIITPQPPLVVPQPPTCTRLGIGENGLGFYDC